MNLSLQDKLALIYTSAGSQRAVARMVGVSHQKIGRALKTGTTAEGGYAPNSRALKNPEFIAQIEQAFQQHTALVVARAKADKLPFRTAIPIYLERMPKTVKHWVTSINKRTGEVSRHFITRRDENGRPIRVPGERASALHTHWLSDKLRNRWLAAMYESKKFVNVSVGSVVDLALYNRQAEQRRKAEGFYPSPSNMASRTEIKMMRRKRPPIDRQLIQTPYVTMKPGHYTDLVVAAVMDQLERKHQPATGEPGTAYAARVLLQTIQLDKPNAKDKAKQRGKAKTRR